MISAVIPGLPETRGVSLHVWQDDYLPAIAGGNKRFKLGAVLKDAKEQGVARVVTFGGAWSNHIHALAFQAGQHGLGSIGIIRGETGDACNATLSDARRFGMELHFVSREQYRQRHNASYLHSLQQLFPGALLVPEGGSSPSAVPACGAILDELNPGFVSRLHSVACAVGTGATLCGLHQRLQVNQQARGYAVVRDPSREATMQQWLDRAGAAKTPVVIPVYQPRYGQLDTGLLHFIDNFYQANGILLDPLYTAKMLRQLVREIEQGVFPAGAMVLALHTGGLQGWRGFLAQVRQAVVNTSVTQATLAAIEAATEATAEVASTDRATGKGNE